MRTGHEGFLQTAFTLPHVTMVWSTCRRPGAGRNSEPGRSRCNRRRKPSCTSRRSRLAEEERAAGSRLTSTRRRPSTTCDAARRVLAGAKQPLKFVTNFCYVRHQLLLRWRWHRQDVPSHPELVGFLKWTFLVPNVYGDDWPQSETMKRVYMTREERLAAGRRNQAAYVARERQKPNPDVAAPLTLTSARADLAFCAETSRSMDRASTSPSRGSSRAPTAKAGTS